jgi:hypothetical protein
VSTENETKTEVSSNVLYGLAMLGGLGLTFMIVAAGIGVLNLQDMDSSFVGMIVAIGFGLLVTSIGGWAIATRPFEHFDDITVPQYHGHHHEEVHAEVHTDEAHQEAANH